MFRSRTFLTLCITAAAGLAASSASAQTGACCLQNGTCSTATSAACTGNIGTWLGSGVTCPTTGMCYGEREPNSNGKLAGANNAPPALNSGDSLAGIANGTANDATYSISGSTAANNAVDFWILTTAARPLGIYRHEITQVRGTGSATTLRGNAQVNGVTYFANQALQSPSSSKLVWYGFGKQEQIVFEPSGTGASAYLFTLNDTTIASTVATGTLYSGAVTMRVINSGTAAIDSDTWLYDGNLNALHSDNNGPGGADGQLATGDPANTKSSFTRTLTPGTYYLAVAPFNLANNQPSVPGTTESNRANNFVLDYPNAVLCSAVNTSAFTASVQLVDAGGNTVNSPNITWAAGSIGLINFVQFTVGSDPTTGECCVASVCSVTSHDACTASSGAWTTGGSCAPGPCATPTGNCCTSTASCTISTQANCASGLWTASGSCTPNPCTAQCCSASGACTVATRSDCTGYWNLTAATCDSNPCPQPTAACCDILNGTCIIVYAATSCGAGTATVATAGATCTPSPCPTAVIGTCCSNSSGTCTLLFSGTCNATSFTSSSSLTCNPSPCPATGTCCDSAGNCTLIFGGSCASGLTPGIGSACGPSTCSVLNVCCDNTTGACTLNYSGSCGTGTTQVGSGVVCSPDPCAPAISGTCCNSTSGACSVVYSGGGCGTGTTANASLTCSPTTCPAIGTCCNLSTGGCTPLFSGSCGANTTANASLTCSPTPCAPAGICCSSSGGCTVNYGATCTGSLNTAVTACGTGSSPNSACPAQGICCLFASGSCTVTYSGGCVSNAAFHTDTTCSAGTPSASCVPYAAATCCSSLGACSVIYGGSCAGRQSTDTSCSPTTCPPIGTCCNTTTGGCTLLYSGSCTGTSSGAGTACDANACAAYGGACCFGTTCSFLDQTTCGGIGGSWISGGTCTPNACVANDTCAGAIPIVIGSSTIGNNADATDDASPIPAACNIVTSYKKSVWYTFVEGDTAHRLSANACDAATDFDTQIAVFSATGPCTGFACVWANYNVLGNTLCPASTRTDIATCFFCTQPNTMYYILVSQDAATGTSGGNFVLHLDDTGEGCGAPANDACVNARTLTTMPSQQLAFIDHATDDAVDVSCDTITGNARLGVWYKHTPSTPGSYTFSEPGGIDVVITFFTTTDCINMTEVACTTIEDGSAPIFHGDAGTTYYILVSMASGTATLPTLPLEINTFNFMADPGACCTTGFCSITSGDSDCTAGGGVYRGSGTTCSPDPCAGGVCCRGSTCSTAYPDAASCAAALDTVAHSGQAKFVATSTTCNAPGSNTGPCCYANYNHNATIEVQDIFDFLSDWFAGKKGAVVGGDGATGTPQVHHIFNFLSAWFAGGCT